MKRKLFIILLLSLMGSCKAPQSDTQDISQVKNQEHFDWGAANVYFMLTDRFNNGDSSNDQLIIRDQPTGKLRGFEGGDFAGVIEKIDEGYFKELGVNVIWLTPIWEQIHGGVDEGTGFTYAFHGYWAKDWTAVEPSYGTQAEFQELVDKAHDQGIRILLDVVLNHTGPVTEQDPLWPEEWVRTEPVCTYQNQATAVSCTLTDNLPDIRTESQETVELPEHLIAKWKKEGRYEQEVSELNAFFDRTGLVRTPANYIIKWITDYARETGVDGFRVDTVKHVEEALWTTLSEQARVAYESWRLAHPEKVFHQDDFFILGELYGYNVANGTAYGFSDTQVDYYDYGYDALINFGFKSDANLDYQELFRIYDNYRKRLQNQKGQQEVYFMNYISSHDDGQPFDAERTKTFQSASKLLLSPGMAQIYYGDEVGRPLNIGNTQGDAALRSMMQWSKRPSELLKHWQKLGQFRRIHPAVGAGEHFSLPYTGEGTLAARFYSKIDYRDKVIIGAGLLDGPIIIDVTKVFPEATSLYNAYTGKKLAVQDGKVTAQVVNQVVLLELK